MSGLKKTFTITCEIKGDQYSLIVAPSEKSKFREVKVPITEDQWDLLRFNFGTANDDSNKAETKVIPLIYINS